MSQGVTTAGGAAGIGEAIVRLFVKHGAKVIIADIADQAGKRLSEELGICGTYVHCDVSKEEDVSAAVDLAVRMHGCLDIMYNNAAILGKSCVNNVGEYDMEDFDRGGLAPYAYTASKHAIVGLMKNGAAELGQYGIRVNSVSPTGVATAMTVKYVNGSDSSVTEENMLNVEKFADSVANLKGPTLKAQDIAEAGLYLASDEAKYVSGHNLVVDGGVTVVNHSWGLYR
eukprot:Gb_30884 [translate_table: standard]